VRATGGPQTIPGGERTLEAKLKHLEFIQATIARLATNSFLFKGWAITIAAGLSAFAAVNSKRGLLAISLISTVMFWALDGYYLWLERCFRRLYQRVAMKDEADIHFAMEPEKSQPFRQWLHTCFSRPHLWLFYGSIILVEFFGIFAVKAK
jgi:hypothetical protein